MPEVSVIVPVYNLSQYINKCIDSLRNQSVTDIEIILVNDGSSDNSAEICQKEAEFDNRIIAVNKENGGVSSARNCGIENAKGRYLCFIDGDDYVTPDYIKNMLDIMKTNDVDIVTSNQYKIWNSGKKQELFGENLKMGEFIIKSGTETLSDMLYGKTCYATCCCKLYKREIFEEIRFPSFSMGEDSYTMYSCFLKAKNVAHLRSPDYYYLQHESSAMHSTNYDKFYDYIMLSDDFMKRVNDSYPELYPAAVNRLIENNFWVYMKMRKQPERYSVQLSHITDNIKKYRKDAMVDKNVNPRTRIACALSYMGMKTLNLVYDIFQK